MGCITLYVKSIHINKSYIIFVCLVIFICAMFLLVSTSKNVISILTNSNIEENGKKDYIKWVDFNISYDALDKTSKLDITSHSNNSKIQYNWIELLAYLACKNGGNFSNFKNSDLENLKTKLNSGETISDLTKDMKYYNYYYEAYSAVLSGFIGEYEIEVPSENNTEKSFVKKYGIKAFSPIAKNYSFNHYKDFGNSRSYGFNRKHLGNDLMGSIGTPIIAVESGTVEALGWNQYGGWRIGIRSFDKKRYYYYAHLRKNHPYVKNLVEGQTVNAGDVIGYLGMTGYSTKENVNNINVPHLHFGMQLIFDESQKEGNNEIWIDVYNIIEFLKKNKSEVYMKDTESKDYVRKYEYMDTWD